MGAAGVTARRGVIGRAAFTGDGFTGAATYQPPPPPQHVSIVRLQQLIYAQLLLLLLQTAHHT
jgi:hypothetical protein